MAELRECPCCGKTDTVGLTDCHELQECKNFECCESYGYVCIVCDVNKGGCGASGGYAQTADEAAQKWNRRPAPENKPLTLEELQQMDGEPVWTVGTGANRSKSYWCLVMRFRESVYTVVGDEMVEVGEFCQYGKTWLAYRRKPEVKNDD